MKKSGMILLACALVAGVFLMMDGGKQTPAAAATVAPTREPAAQTDAAPEAEREIVGLSGLIGEVTPEYLVITDAELGEVRVNLGEETVFEGVEHEALAVGQYVYIDYDGKMTRSLPPQVFAMRVYAHVVSGTVTAVEEGSVTLDQDGSPVVVHLPEGAPALAPGQHVTAYTSGMMTMSLPPQVSAGYVTCD